MNTTTKKTILLVEDEALIAMNTKMELEKYGYSVRTVTTGEQAVEAVKASSDIDLILMDINLGPGIDGTEAADIILKDHDIPIVFLSSHTDPEVVEKTEKITSYGYVVKNSGLTVLDASIKMAFKLFEARRQVTDTFTHSINGLCVHRAIRDESGKLYDCEYVSVNSAFEQHTGFSSEKLIGHTIRDLFPESDAEGIIRLHDEILSGGADARQEIYFAPTQQWFEISAFRTHGNEFTVVVQNITERKRAEEELEKTTYILKSQQETAPYGVLVVDEDDQIVSFNQVFADIWRISDEIMALQSGEKALAFVLPQLRDPDRFVEEIANLTATRQPEESREIPLTDGRTLIRYSYPMISDRGGYLGRVWYYEDISERKRAEDRLKQVLREYDTVFHSTQDAMFLVEVIDKDTYRFIRNNRVHLEATGFTTEVVQNKTPQELLGTELGDELAGNYRRCVETADCISYEETLHFPGGAKTWHTTLTPVFEKGEVKYLVGSAQDITERKQAEEELEKRTRELESIFKSATSISLIKTDLKSVVEEFSSGAEVIFGYDRSEMIGNHVGVLHTKEESERLAAYVEKLKHGQGFTLETRLVKKSGEEFPAILSLQPVLDEQGVVISTLGITFDITERKQAEQEMKHQLAEKETLFREVHHRIKNNMAQVESLLSLQADSAEDSGVKSALHVANSRVRSTRILYEKLLVGKGHQEVSIKEYLDRLIESHAEVYNDNAGVSVEKSIVDFSLSSRKAIPIGIIVNELLTNVFKYAFGNRDEGHVLIKLEKSDSWVTLIVQDDGIGFDSRVAANKSPGFGLTLTQMLAEQLGGTFSIENENGTRSVIEFEI